jgi:isopenicillin N synthase-like dioxygenase
MGLPPISNVQVPVIDLSQTSEHTLIDEIAEACSTVGFFQVIHHGISDELVAQFRSYGRQYFTELDPNIKEEHRRNETNARGYFDDELTKQRRDWKQALDVGVPGSRDWNVPDNDPSNQCLDGYNKFPTEEQLSGFRETIKTYFEACTDLSHRLTVLMAAGIPLYDECECDAPRNTIVEDLRTNHTSYLRLNYYPACPPDVLALTEQKEGSPPLGISPHRDAGFLTVLLPDEDCHSLQVWIPDSKSWYTVIPITGALTINTGDMAQIWSNGTYKAPLHRVLTHPESTRFSAPFFYNPGYSNWIRPVHRATDDDKVNSVIRYHPCLWGYFRAVRFAGDLTDLGVEIQMEDYGLPSEEGVVGTSQKGNRHWTKQTLFEQTARFDEPFSVERFRDLLVG